MTEHSRQVLDVGSGLGCGEHGAFCLLQAKAGREKEETTFEWETGGQRTSPTGSSCRGLIRGGEIRKGGSQSTGGRPQVTRPKGYK